MKNGRYIFLLAMLTVLLFGVSEWLPKYMVTAHKQTQKAVTPTNKPISALERQGINKPEASSRPRATVVTLYPAGSLNIKKPKPKSKTAKKKTKVKPPKPHIQAIKTPTPQRKPTPETKDIPRINRTYDGDRPTLEVGYEEIGFDRYIDVMERVGRLFSLLDEGGRVTLGPEVSLKRKALLGDRGIEDERYALNRPHLIADPFIESLLINLDLPTTALKDRVVLVFNRPFDNLLWDVIGDVASSYDLNLTNISQLSGKYVDRENGIYLQFTGAMMKDTRKVIPFNRSIRVTL